VLEAGALADLLDPILPDWRSSGEAKAVLTATVDKDDVMFFCGQKRAFKIYPMLKMARAMGLGFGQMVHGGDYICSASKLTAWLCRIAVSAGVEVMHGFAAEDIVWDSVRHCATGVKLVDQGRNKEGHKERNYLAGETISADAVILAEGCDGLLSEKFIVKAGLVRQGHPLYSIGGKELIRVSDEQYQKFTPGRWFTRWAGRSGRR
jgi:electron-transferring-flavoprotein dehydrogenase